MQLNDKELLGLVVIICERLDVRSVARNAVKELGAKNVVSLSSLDEATDFFKSTNETPGWIFTSLDVSSDYNWVSFLSGKLESPDLKKTLVTALVTEDQFDELPLAYELGIISHIKMPFTHNELVASINAMIDKGERCSWNLAEVAADNFREYLNEKEAYDELISLEQSLVDRFPDNPSYLVKLAEAQFAKGDLTRAKNIINRAAMLGGDVKVAAQQLKDLITADNDSEIQQDFAEAFELNSCMLVDPDESARNLAKNALSAIGVTRITEASDGQEAYEKFDFKNPPDLVLTEWQMPALNGAQFIQRIVHELKTDVIILVASSGVSEEDMPLIREMRVSGHIPKPIDSDQLRNLVTNRVIATRTSRDAEVVYNKIHLAIRNEDKSQALKLYATYKGLEKRDPITDLLVEGEINYLKGFYDQAKKNAFAAFSKSGGNLAAGSLITKILLTLKQPSEALKTMEWLQSVSPQNLERLCTMAEIKSEMGQNEQAQKLIDDAEKIDKDAKLTKETTAKVSLNSGDTSAVKSAMEKMTSLAPLVTYMNNRAVLLVRQGDTNTGVKLYQDALEALPDGRNKEKAAITYNLSLAFARINKLGQANNELGKIKKDDHPRLHDKVVSLKRNIEVAIQKNITLKFKNQPEATTPASRTYMPVPCGLPGELGLHLVYSCRGLERGEVQEMLKKVREISLPSVIQKSA